MEDFLLRLSRTIDYFNRWIGKAAAWAIVVAIVVSALNALSRHLFGITSNAWLEVQWYLFGAVFMLCAAWTMQDNEHVRIDVLSARFSRRTRDIIDLIGHMLFLLPFVALMVWLSTQYFWKAVLSQEMSPNEGGLPLWPAKGLIFIGFVQLALQWLSEVIKSVSRLRRHSTTSGNGASQ
jgi:TRAP-type mannitol/chloroaromatic compound transport system permease small subunit